MIARLARAGVGLNVGKFFYFLALIIFLWSAVVEDATAWARVTEGPAGLASSVVACKTNERSAVEPGETLRYTICLRNLSGLSFNLVVSDLSGQLINLSSGTGMACASGGGSCWRWAFILEPNGQKTLKLEGRVIATPGQMLTNTLRIEDGGDVIFYIEEDEVVEPGGTDFVSNDFECNIGDWTGTPSSSSNIPVCKCDDEDGFFSDGWGSGDNSAWASTTP